MTSHARALITALLAALPVGALAQDAPSAQAAPIGRIVFESAAPYTDAELLRVVRLHTGDLATEAVLNDAVHTLSATGLFADVSAGMDVIDNVPTLIFKLKPVPDADLLCVSFTNLIWFTPEELNAAVRKALPIYHLEAGHGEIGEQGKSADQIESVLADMLAKRNIKATLAHDILPPSFRHPYRAMEFKVTDPPIRVYSVTVVGGPVALVNAEVTAQKQATGKPFNQGIAGDTLEDTVLGPVLDAGYLGAKLTDVKIERSSTPAEIGILYSARIVAGPLYKIGSVAWSVSPVYPVYTQQDFARDCELHPGMLPRESAIANTRKTVLAAFQKNGYITAELKVDTDLDEKNGTVNYAFSVNPGEQYVIGAVTTSGLPPAAQSEFNANFALKSGQPLDMSYIDNFLVTHQNLKALAGYGFTYTTTANPQTHQVDLAIAFSR